MDGDIVVDDVDVVDDQQMALDPSAQGDGSANDPSGSSGARRTGRIRQPAERAILAANAEKLELQREKELSAEARSQATRLRPRFQAKVKLKLSDKLAAMAPGMSFLGPYDRELDSDEEDLVFEEQFLLRMPEGEDSDKLRKMVAAREISKDVYFKFKDARRAVFHVGNTSYASKLVDLPCIIESQKTLDNKAMFKVADICQMLVVENRIENEEDVIKNKPINIDEYIWPHGMTPPLNWVRKRRFRKRINKRTIESVEEEVERLLAEDQQATEHSYEILDNVNPDLSDSEFLEKDEDDDLYANAPVTVGAGSGRAPQNRSDSESSSSSSDSDSDKQGDDGDFDEDLAAELKLALGDDDDDDSQEERTKGKDSSSSDNSDDSGDENVQGLRLLNEEISDLQTAVRRKNHEIASSANPLIRRRFEDALKKLSADLDLKTSQRSALLEVQRKLKDAAENGAPAAAEGDDEEDDDDEDDDGDDEMDVS